MLLHSRRLTETDDEPNKAELGRSELKHPISQAAVCSCLTSCWHLCKEFRKIVFEDCVLSC